jgi:hypothetical protein
MQSDDAGSPGRDDLLECRAAMLGLDLDAIKSRGGNVLETIKQRCKRCASVETCELDLRRDPNDPVWETYCPNTATFIALAEIDELKD